MLPDITGLTRENVNLDAGYLLIFNSLSAHGVWPNHSERRVRKAQYISMAPAETQNKVERDERVRLWQEIEPPKRPDFSGDPRNWEKNIMGQPN